MEVDDFKDLINSVTSASTEKAIELYNIAKDSGILDLIKDLLIVIKGTQAIITVNQWFFVKKIQIFTKQLSKYDQEKFKYNWSQINEKKRIKIITQLLIQLDRANTELKAKIYAETIRARIENRISPEQFDYIIYSVEMIHPMGFEHLKLYYEHTGKDDLVRQNAEYSSLSSSGFLTLPKGGAFLDMPMGAFISDLGTIFYNEIFSFVDSVD